MDGLHQIEWYWLALLILTMMITLVLFVLLYVYIRARTNKRPGLLSTHSFTLINNTQKGYLNHTYDRKNDAELSSVDVEMNKPDMAAIAEIPWWDSVYKPTTRLITV